MANGSLSASSYCFSFALLPFIIYIRGKKFTAIN